LHLLLVESHHPAVALGAGDLAHEFGWDVQSSPTYETAYQAAQQRVYDVTILPTPDPHKSEDQAGYRKLIELIANRDGAALLIGNAPESEEPAHRGIVDHIAPDAPAAELRGRFAMIDRYHERFRQLEGEVRRMEQLGKRLNEHFREIDQEMHLAARLQKDFLPDLIDPIGNIRFATIYRPASWVSGDIFDVFRIDENHTGIYVADAVGHGVAASLLTMFIKRSIVAKRVRDREYDILTPSETMGQLNDALASQGLPNCQFVTAFYAIINHQTLTMQFARGGHPYPIHTTAQGAFHQLKSTGGLLGLFAGETFSTQQIQLAPGDKIIVYTDGVELAFQSAHPDTLDTSAYLQSFKSVAALPVREMMDQLGHVLDDESGSINPSDDITILGLEVLTDR